METQQNPNEPKEKDSYTDWGHQQHSPAGRIMGGMVIIAIGAIFLAQQLGALIPDWVFTWQMGLIAVGIFIGALHAFRGAGWLFPIAIGGFMLIDKFYPAVQVRNYILPAVIIFIGLVMIFNSRRKARWYSYKHRYGKHNWHWDKWQHHQSHGYQSTTTSTGDYIDSSSVFGGIRKNIVSKNFMGGEVVSVFGGSEINLSQADISGRVVLEVTQVFGGTRLIVPPNWQIDFSEVAAVLGTIEDKRVHREDMPADPNKVLVLKGSSVFGGLEITNF